MHPPKSRNKIYSLAIICLGLVIAFWAFTRKPSLAVSPIQSNDSVVVSPYKSEDLNTNTDWQKILTSSNSGNQITTSLVSADDFENGDETTVTANLSRDLFSRYMLIAKQDGGFTSEDANNIAATVLSDKDYTEANGAVYISSNLKISSLADINTITNYNIILSQKLQNRIVKTPGTPIDIITAALRNESEKDLAKLNPFIATYKGVISDLLNIEVPKSAVKVHLALLNAYSNILASTEAMRVILTDPIRGAAGISQYESRLNALQKAFDDINAYFIANQ